MILSVVMGLLIAIFSFFGISLIKKRIFRFVSKKHADHYSIKTAIAKRLIELTSPFFLLIFSLFLGSLFIALEENARFVIGKTTLLCFIFLIGLWSTVLVNHAIEIIGAHYEQKKGISKAVFNMLRTFCKIAIWMLLFLFMLDNLHFQISTLIAGLGIGGIALALAVQNILQDLFASLSILIDEPFQIGDLIVIDQYKGYVEYIGIKTTRVRSVDGEQIVFANGDLLRSRLRNYKKMEERRVTLILEVTYETPFEKIKQIPSLVKQIILSVDHVRFSRVHLKEFGNSGLHFEVVYYVLSAETMIYMDKQHQVNELILENFAKEQIEFAYPTTKVFANISQA